MGPVINTTPAPLLLHILKIILCSMDSRLQQLFKNFGSGESWRGKCVDKLSEAVKFGDQTSIIASLVGEEGLRGITRKSPLWKAEEIWGIDINTCYKYCSRTKFPMITLPLPVGFRIPHPQN